MSYFKKNILFFTLGFFFLSDISAMSKKCADIGFSKCETKEVFGSKSNEKFLMIFNDARLFKNQTLEAYNKAFQVDLSSFQWMLGHEDLIKSLESADLKYFFHAIKDKNGEVVSFVYGEFCAKEPGNVHIDRLGTLLDYEKNGLAWRLIMSVFDRYQHIKKISLEPLSSAVSYYKEHGFKEVFDGDFKFSRIDAEKIDEQLKEKYKKL